MAQATDIAIVSGARTPMGRYCGKLRDFTAMDLAAIASLEAIQRSGVDAKDFDHAVFGNAQQTSGDAPALSWPVEWNPCHRRRT